MVTGAAVSSVLSTNGLGTLLGSRKRRLAVNLPEHGEGRQPREHGSSSSRRSVLLSRERVRVEVYVAGIVYIVWVRIHSMTMYL